MHLLKVGCDTNLNHECETLLIRLVIMVIIGSAKFSKLWVFLFLNFLLSSFCSGSAQKGTWFDFASPPACCSQYAKNAGAPLQICRCAYFCTLYSSYQLILPYFMAFLHPSCDIAQLIVLLDSTGSDSETTSQKALS